MSGHQLVQVPTEVPLTILIDGAFGQATHVGIRDTSVVCLFVCLVDCFVLFCFVYLIVCFNGWQCFFGGFVDVNCC